jgi:hypothetical protein
VWTDTRPDPVTYGRVLTTTIAEQMRWRAEYQAAKDRANQTATEQNPSVDTCSTTGPAP